MMKLLKNYKFRGKTVLVRCDFNVSFDEKGVIYDDFRIRSALPTIQYLLSWGAKIILMTHLGDKKSSKKILPRIEELLNEKVSFIQEPNSEIEAEIKNDPFPKVYLLENLRFFDGEKNNSIEFAKKIARLGDHYVNEAFSVCHREHASVFWLPKLLPNCAGIELVKEVNVLSKVRKDPRRPLVVIIGGAKISSKAKVINSFLLMADHVLLGGKLANDVLVVKGMSPNRSWPEEDVVNVIKTIELTSPKIHLPVDLIVSDSSCDDCLHIIAPGAAKKDDNIFDIGSETIRMYSDIIKDAKMIIWAGPLGLFEDSRFENGTREIGKAISRNFGAFRIIGGGDTGLALHKFKIRDNMDHVSTGGGAMLYFLTQGNLPGLKVLGYED